MAWSRRAGVPGLAVAAAAVIVGGALAAQAQNDASAEAGMPLLPDVVESVPHHLQIQNKQQRELLRFSTTHINVGDGPLQIRGGGQVRDCEIDDEAYSQCTEATQEVLDAAGTVVHTQPAGLAVFHPEHNHWHQEAVARFAVLPGGADDPVPDSWPGGAITEGTKVTFCLIDVKFTGATGSLKKASPRTYFDCNADLQGISPGWADSYHQSTAGQQLDVTGLPQGDYYLVNEADPVDHWWESDEGNNLTWVRFRLDRSSGANPSVVVLGTSPCEPAIICAQFKGNPG